MCWEIRPRCLALSISFEVELFVLSCARLFPPARGSSIARSVQFKPRLVVNSVRAALAAAVGGLGVTRLYTVHVAERVHDGSLRLLLRDAEPRPCRSTFSCRRGACRFQKCALSWTWRSPACARSSQGCRPRPSR